MHIKKNKSILSALKCSIDGIKDLSFEKAAIREFFLLIISVLYVFLFRPSLPVSMFLIILPLFLLSIEAINTAIELICDKITKKKNIQIKKIKDLGSASILILFVSYIVVFITSLLEITRDF